MPIRKCALILGITGQTGSYLAELLHGKGYIVHGIMRRSSSFNTGRIDHLYSDPHANGGRLYLHFGDLLDPLSIRRTLSEVYPDEVYNLAAQSHVKVSFDQPVYTAETVAIGALNILEAVRDYAAHDHRDVRFYQASSSEMFGGTPPPQNEQSPFRPRSPYACAKVHAYWATVNYREAYNLFASNGILFNHESPRRGETFVTRKITRAATRIKLGLQDRLFLGNLDARRDWGFAGDYAEAIWRILQHPEADDFVVGTGVSHSVREFCAFVFSYLELDYGQFVSFDERYLRPTEVDFLEADSTKARTMLSWKPKTGFEALATMMVEADLKLARREAAIGELEKVA